MKSKMELFRDDFSDKKLFEQNLEKLFQYIFLNIFPNILNLPRIDFMNSLMTSVKSILEEHYSDEIYSDEKFFSLFLSVNKIFETKYKDYNQILSSTWDKYQQEKLDNNIYFTDFQKHCGKTQEHAIHLCNKNETGKYLIVHLKNDIKFIICENCRKSYYANLFINYCINCECNYYSGLISKKENSSIQLATYLKPHCESIANDKISCLRCKNPLYYNIKDNMVECLNQKCKYKIKPNLGNWKCNTCSNYFKSDIKIYNSFDLLFIKRICGIALLIKQRAHPGILPCCQNLEEKNLIFYHKKDCKGIVYFWILNQKIIVICEKCKAINYFSRFIWTCPKCGLHFRAKKEEIEDKIKKNLLHNLKKKFNIHILLGDEFLLNNSDSNINYDTLINEEHKIVRKKSFRELLNQKRKEYSKEKSSLKEKEEDAHKQRKINQRNNDNLISSISSKKITIEEESNGNSNSKKRKNYLFDRLLRNQFVTQKNISDSKNKPIYKRGSSNAFYLTEEKNTIDETKSTKNNNAISVNRFRQRANSGIIKNNFEAFLEKTNLKYENKIDKENKDINTILIDNDKKNEKNNKKNLPPLPFRIRHKLNNYENKNKLKLYLEFKYEKQSYYKTPKMILININKENKSNNDNNIKNINNNLKKNLSDKIIHRLTIDSFELNIKQSKNNKIVRKFDYKFKEDYNQKKTKDKTDSDDKSDKGEKIVNKNEDTEVILKNKNNIGFKNIRESKIKKNEISNNDNKIDEHKKNNNEIVSIDNERKNINLYKRFKEKEKDLDSNIKKINIISRPSDIMNISLIEPQLDIPIENESIKKDKKLYDSIQTQLKKILSKGKLPIFNIENYKIEKQIGEGSFGVIYQVMNKKNYVRYALKKIIAKDIPSLESFQKEFEIVHQNSHPNILDILGICIRCLDQTTFVLYVLMDLAIYDWDFEIEDRKKKKKYFTEKELISILKQITSALFFLQRVKKIAHRDVKPENILVFNDGVYKLSDFGEAKINRLRRNNARSTIRGTEMYMSPALFKALQENKDDIQHDIYKSDVFSLGYCFVFAAVLDFKIIEDIRNLNNDFKVKKILQRILFLRYSTDFIELLYKMIAVKEEDRIDFIELDRILKEKKF